jgi:diguanylate cyclase (GGDEF)-like protein/PAS domain S-box-containing protein
VTTRLRILLVEDNPLDAELMERTFREARIEATVTRVESETAYVAELEALPHIVISDYQLPQFSGPRALELLRARYPDLPFILVSGTIGEDRAVEIVRLGADDYLLKDRLARLPGAAEKAVAAAEERAAQRAARADVEAGLRRAQAMAKLAHIITGPEGEFESWSESLPQLAARDAGTMPRSTRAWLELIHLHDRELFRAKSIEAGESRERTELKYRLRRPDGSLVDVRQTMEPLGGPDAQGRLRWFNTLQDITETTRAEQALRESEGLKSAIIQASLDALVTIDEKGNIVEFNPAAEAAFGHRREHVLGQSMAALIMPPRLRDAHFAGFTRYLQTGEAPIFGKRLELAALRADGSEFPIELTVVPIRGQAAPVFTGFIRDITARKLAEERIKRLNRVYAVLSGINGALVRIRQQQELFEEACRIAVGAGSFVMAWVGLVDREAGIVDPVASAGNIGDFFERAPMAVLESKEGSHGLSGRAIRTKTPMLSNDVMRDPQRLMRKELGERGINSLAILPLVVEDEAIGVLALYAADVGFFDEEEMRLLTELAGDVSFALDNIAKARKLDYISYYDPLTGLPNRNLFHERLRLQLEDAARQEQRVALQILDLERFKTINDSMGRQAGDTLLKELARRMQEGVHTTSWLARMGADHFAIVTPGVKTEQEVARRTEKRAAETFAAPFVIGGTELRVSARIGTAFFPNDGADADTLLRGAEAAVKKAKASGERYVFYTQEMSARVADKLSLENQLRRALDNDEFVLHYQPKVELEGRRVVGLEALMRWQSPQLGLVAPIKFIPVLEETGMIIEVGAWALKRAALDQQAWAAAGLAPPRVAVNVSAIQLRQRDFVRVVEQAIAAGGASRAIDLELTESLIMEDIQASIEKLGALRRLGVGMAIDDFGTGYSSLAYLARLPVEVLKIDRSFSVAMAQDPAAMTLVQTIISLAHSLRLKVVAEGVETEEQAKVLRLLRCDQMQGYVFSKPVPKDAVPALIAVTPKK